jgi:hypothetical protein
LPGQTYFAVSSGNISFSVQEHRGVVHHFLFFLQNSGYNILSVALSQIAKKFSRWPRNRLAGFHIRELCAYQGYSFRQTIRVLTGRVPDQFTELFQIIRKSAISGTMVNSGQSHHPGARYFSLLEVDPSKADFSILIPAVDQFNSRFSEHSRVPGKLVLFLPILHFHLEPILSDTPAAPPNVQLHPATQCEPKHCDSDLIYIFCQEKSPEFIVRPSFDWNRFGPHTISIVFSTTLEDQGGFIIIQVVRIQKVQGGNFLSLAGKIPSFIDILINVRHSFYSKIHPYDPHG